jgi:transcriptional regulator with XRE-family HTH domain
MQDTAIDPNETPQHKLPAVRWKELQRKAKALCEKHGSKIKLAKALNIRQSKLSKLLNDEAQPRAEIVLALHEWVVAQESKIFRTATAHDPRELKAIAEANKDAGVAI